jgi:hypothetical protein
MKKYFSTSLETTKILIEILDEIERRATEYENTAEELFQERDDPEDGNSKLSMAKCLRELAEFIKT